MELSVILPVYSETDSLRKVVDELFHLLDGVVKEIVLVIHHSSGKETFKVCSDLSVKYPEVRILIQRSNGLGNGIREGLAFVSGSHTLLMDSDGEMLPETVPKMIAKMSNRDYDVVVASRWMKGGGAIGYAPLKYIFVRFFNWVFRFLFRTGIHDLSLGFKILNTRVIKDIQWEGIRHEIATETTLKPIRLGYKVGEVPTVWVRRNSGRSKNWKLANVRYIQMALSIWRGKWKGKS